jgi:predicted RNA-binding protein (virulence factor B family)
MDLNTGDKVKLIIRKETNLGYKVIINDEFEGLLFRSDVFKPLYEGEETEGYIKLIREDGLIDVSIKPQGYRKAIGINASDVLSLLEQQNGFLALNDKSSPEEIERALHMSKKSFKVAIGALYKQGLIKIEDRGISLV